MGAVDDDRKCEDEDADGGEKLADDHDAWFVRSASQVTNDEGEQGEHHVHQHQGEATLCTVKRMRS